jgi:site-specific DNA-methyltransferase (adenine-specific)
MKNQVILGDCLEVMKLIPDKSIDAIISDLPYGTTACKWDTIIPFEPLWEQYKRIIKDNGAIVLTASQPFTSALVMSNIKMFRYSLVWDKVNKYTNAFNANRMPMKRHEDILVFYKKLPTYNPQYRKGVPYTNTRPKGKGEVVGGQGKSTTLNISTGEKAYPGSVIAVEGQTHISLHPTQKPVALFEYLIKTYTNEGDLVLDNCAGSGTTGVACKNLNRNFILIEKEQEYIDIINERLSTPISLD